MHVTGPQMHGFYRSILYSHHNFGNIQKFRQSRSFFFFYFLFLCLSFSDQGTGAFLILNESSDVRELQQAIGRSVGNEDERPLCDSPPRGRSSRKCSTTQVSSLNQRRRKSARGKRRRTTTKVRPSRHSWYIIGFVGHCCLCRTSMQDFC